MVRKQIKCFCSNRKKATKAKKWRNILKSQKLFRLGPSKMAQEVPTLTLVIKNPAQSREFEVKINADASISVLKKILEESYPGNPVSFSQKLIFAGRLLNDTDILGDIFSQRKVTSITDIALYS